MNSLSSNVIHNLIKANPYIKRFKSQDRKDIHSFSYLVDKKFRMTHSDCIKLGIAMEKILTDIILEFNKDIIDIKIKNQKNKRERDHIFKDDVEKVIYYCEIKSNLNLDTEKSCSTIAKCLDIVEELKDQYPAYDIKWGLVGLRYHNKNNIPSKISNKYKKIEENILGINDYLSMLNISLNFTHRTYTTFVNSVVNQLLDSGN